MVSPTVGAAQRSAEGAEDAVAVRSNRKRALRLCLVPAVVVGVVVFAVLAAVGLPVFIGAIALVVVGTAVLVWLWSRAPGSVVRALDTRPSLEWERPRLHNLVDGLCATMGLSPPAILVLDSPVPNALALGRDPTTAVLVVTSALDTSLSLTELEGVLAHELVYIKRMDIVVAGVAVVTTRPMAVVRGKAWGAARVHRLIGEGRAFDADQRAARVVRYPPGIAAALDVMAGTGASGGPWPPGSGLTAALTRWLWVDPMAGTSGESVEGNLDDTRVRAAALALL